MSLTLEEYQALVQPCTLSPLQKELMSWCHRLYNLSFHVLFCLSSMVFLVERLMERWNKPPLYVACQFGTAHCRPWRTKVKKSGSIFIPKQTEPVDGMLIYQIFSYQPGHIPQLSVFLTGQSRWGCITPMDHIIDYFYVNLMRYLSFFETLMAKEAL